MDSYDDLLIVAATPVEVEYVPPEVPVAICGIGKTAAAIAVTRTLMEYPIDRRTHLTVINLGTAGSLRDGVEGLHEVGSVLNHDLNADVLRSLGVEPQEWLQIDADRPIRLATGDVFVTDTALRDRLARHADLVDMEGYAIALACRRLGASVRIVKHVSDSADADAMAWPDLVDASAQVLGAWVAEQLELDQLTASV